MHDSLVVFIGIDPGKSGAIAVMTDTNISVVTNDKIDALNILKQLDKSMRCFAILEQVHSFPGQGVSSTFSLGDSFGYMRGVLEALEIPYQLAAPQKWKRVFGLSQDKQQSIDVCKRLFPHVNLLATERSRKPHDGIAEAVLLAEYARRVHSGKVK